MARIVFDLDGTLIDSAPDIHGIANAILAQEDRASVSLSQVRGFIGNGAGVFVRKLCQARSLPDEEHSRLLADFVGRYEDAVSLTKPYPGVASALESLRTAGHRLGICTNKPVKPTHAVLKYLELNGFFSVNLRFILKFRF